MQQQQRLTIGRDQSNDMCIRDTQISAFHAEVKFDPERGGFLLVVTVRPHARAEVEEALSGGEPPLAEIVEVDVDREGLTLSVEGRPQVRL